MSDIELQVLELLRRDPQEGWRRFVDQYTPTILALIERGGITSRDEAMEVYVRTCERLTDNACARLRAFDPARGALASWLAVLVRNITIDWVRSRAGRRRVFEAVKRLDARAQRVFELYYFDDRRPGEIAEVLSSETGYRTTLSDVFDALDAIERELGDRQRAELVSWTARARPLARLDDPEEGIGDIRSDQPDPERALRVRQLESALNRALVSLPPIDAAIVRLKFVHGLSNRDIERALHSGSITAARIAGILSALRGALSRAGEAADRAGSPLRMDGNEVA